MEYAVAKTYLAEAVAADPFAMEDFRKFGFFANLAIVAVENKKYRMALIAFNKMIALEESAKLDVFADITGVMPAIYHAARAAFSEAVAAS